MSVHRIPSGKAAAASAGGRLDSWKEIAAYVGRDERTAQRWHRLYGLPVRRPAGRAGTRVFAFSDEIDAWLAAQVRRQAAGSVGEAGPAPARGWGAIALILLALVTALLALLLLGEEAAASAEPASLAFLRPGLAARTGAGRGRGYFVPRWKATAPAAQRSTRTSRKPASRIRSASASGAGNLSTEAGR